MDEQDDENKEGRGASNSTQKYCKTEMGICALKLLDILWKFMLFARENISGAKVATYLIVQLFTVVIR